MSECIEKSIAPADGDTIGSLKFEGDLSELFN